MLLLLMAAVNCGALAQESSDTTRQNKQNFIYVLTLLPEYQIEAAWTPEIQHIARRHYRYLKDLHEAGLASFVGRTDYAVDNPENFGLVIFYAKDSAEAVSLMQNDPAVQHPIMTAEVHPFKTVFPRDP